MLQHLLRWIAAPPARMQYHALPSPEVHYATESGRCDPRWRCTGSNHPSFLRTYIPTCRSPCESAPFGALEANPFTSAACRWWIPGFSDTMTATTCVAVSRPLPNLVFQVLRRPLNRTFGKAHLVCFCMTGSHPRRRVAQSCCSPLLAGSYGSSHSRCSRWQARIV
jgi:hypothetical protein